MSAHGTQTVLYIALSGLIIDMLMSSCHQCTIHPLATTSENEPPDSVSVASARMCIAINHFWVSRAACGTQWYPVVQLISRTCVSKPTLPVEVIHCLQLPYNGLEQVLKHLISDMESESRQFAWIANGSTDSALFNHHLKTAKGGFRSAKVA